MSYAQMTANRIPQKTPRRPSVLAYFSSANTAAATPTTTTADPTTPTTEQQQQQQQFDAAALSPSAPRRTTATAISTPTSTTTTTRCRRAEFDNHTKFTIISEFLQPNGPSKTEILARYPNLKNRTLNRWIRQQDQILQRGSSGVRSHKKRNYDHDPLFKVKQQVLQFLDQNEQLSTESNGKLHVTGELVGLKAKLIAEELLREDTFLSSEEMDALHKFKGSASWGRRFCADHGRPLGLPKFERHLEQDDVQQQQQQQQQHQQHQHHIQNLPITNEGHTGQHYQEEESSSESEQEQEDESEDDDNDNVNATTTITLDEFRIGMDEHMRQKEDMVEDVLGFRTYQLYKGCFEELCQMAPTTKLKKVLIRGLAMTRQILIEHGATTIPESDTNDSTKRRNSGNDGSSSTSTTNRWSRKRARR